jgi:hypothetical protein
LFPTVIHGKRKKVLIELQKSKGSLDIGRFRRYLGSNDSQDDAAIAAAAGLSLEQVRALRAASNRR